MQRNKNNPKNSSKSSQKSKDTPHLRVNYEDPSLKYSDWVEQMGLEKTFIGRIFIRIDEVVDLKFFSLIAVFAVLLSFLLYFEIESPLDYEVGNIAPHDISSPLSFEMIDEVTTEEKRLKAEINVPVIFDYDSTIFEKVSAGIYRSFRYMRGELKTVQWPSNPIQREEMYKEFFQLKPQFEKELGSPVSDFIFEWLVANRFSARFENILIRNLENWFDGKVADAPERFIPPGQNSVLVRVVQKNSKGKEFTVLKSELIDLQSMEQFVFKDTRGIQGLSPENQSNLLYLGRSLLYPNLTLSKQETASRKQAARDTVLPITISIKKHQTIVTAGMTIQPFHMAIVKKIQTLKSEKRHEVVILATALFFLIMISVFFTYIRRTKDSMLNLEVKDITVMALVSVFMVFVIKLFLFLTESAIIAKFGAQIPSQLFLYAAPIAAAAMMIGLLITSTEIVWLFTIFFSVALGFMVEMDFAFVVVALVSGIAAAKGVCQCKKRSDLYWAGVHTGVVQALSIALIMIVTKQDQPTFFKDLLLTAPAGFLSGIFSSFVALTFIPFLESAFNYTTDVKLLELSNLNHPLLKEMIVKAPGTYHHSMMVGSMVEAAAEEIGANPLLGKVMCYYHDIGKMEHSGYFIENQKAGQNPHDHISPYMSKTLLIAHVKDGLELGMEYKLGKPILDGILQHHGTTLIAFFYNKALDLKQDEDADVPEEDFRYPGPKPQFREAALCMLADSIEAAARSLDEPTPVRLQNIVKNIIQRKFVDGQLDECNLTLRDLSKVETAFIRILLGIYHQRIDYPKSAGGGASESAKSLRATTTRS